MFGSLKINWWHVAAVLLTAVVFFWLTGCAAQPPKAITIERPVIIQSPPEYIPIPPSLFVGCTPPEPAGPTNGDLLLHDHLETAYAICLEGRLSTIKALQ
jgi:hypothetical protein